MAQLGGNGSEVKRAEHVNIRVSSSSSWRSVLKISSIKERCLVDAISKSGVVWDVFALRSF